jgi:hypothetical protein
MFKCSKQKGIDLMLSAVCRILNFGHSKLSFGFAQDGEPVEPFRISVFGIPVYPG